jgi:hypothetical protein
MKKSLFKLQDYAIFTFTSTSQALKAERVLKNSSVEFLMMPTPRQISTSCGLAVKAALDQLQFYQEILLNNDIQIEGAYQITTIEGKIHSERVNNG